MLGSCVNICLDKCLCLGKKSWLHRWYM